MPSDFCSHWGKTADFAVVEPVFLKKSIEKLTGTLPSFYIQKAPPNAIMGSNNGKSLRCFGQRVKGERRKYNR